MTLIPLLRLTSRLPVIPSTILNGKEQPASDYRRRDIATRRAGAEPVA